MTAWAWVAIGILAAFVGLPLLIAAMMGVGRGGPRDEDKEWQHAMAVARARREVEFERRMNRLMEGHETRCEQCPAAGCTCTYDDDLTVATVDPRCHWHGREGTAA